MKKRLFILLVVIFAFGCATTDMPKQVGVELSASEEEQAKAQAETQVPDVKTYKRRIAIGRFTNETNYGKGLLRDADLDPLGKQASDILSADLVQSGKFIIFERTDLNKLVKEQAISGEADLVGVDALILGSVSEFGRTTEGKTGFLSKTKVQKVRAKVTIRLVDPKTGHAFYSSTGAGEAMTESGEIAGFGSKAGFDASLNDKAIRAAISDLMDSMVRSLEERPWKTFILEVKGDQVIIGGGTLQGIKVGDKLVVMKQGDSIRNPQTGFMMELPGDEIARLTVKSTFGKTEVDQGSICMISSGSLNGLSPKNLYVTEPVK